MATSWIARPIRRPTPALAAPRRPTHGQRQRADDMRKKMLEITVCCGRLHPWPQLRTRSGAAARSFDAWSSKRSPHEFHANRCEGEGVCRGTDIAARRPRNGCFLTYADHFVELAADRLMTTVRVAAASSTRTCLSFENRSRHDAEDAIGSRPVLNVVKSKAFPMNMRQTPPATTGPTKVFTKKHLPRRTSFAARACAVLPLLVR